MLIDANSLSTEANKTALAAIPEWLLGSWITATAGDSCLIACCLPINFRGQLSRA